MRLYFPYEKKKINKTKLSSIGLRNRSRHGPLIKSLFCLFWCKHSHEFKLIQLVYFLQNFEFVKKFKTAGEVPHC